MTTIYLIRHAEAEGNLYRIAQGQHDSNLTDLGWHQVQALERRFSNIHIDAVYASDLYRTCATASAIYYPKGLSLHRTPALREICLGAWEQQTWGDIYRRWPEQLEYFGRRPDKWQVEGCELPRLALERVLAAIRSIASENENRTIALFSHAYVIRLVLCYLQGYSLEETGRFPIGGNTGVSQLEAAGDSLRVVFRDDTSHLETPDFLAGNAGRRTKGLKPGLRFSPFHMPDHADFLCELVSSLWQGTAAFDRKRLLEDASKRSTFVGFLEESPVGVLQMGEDAERISLACIHPDLQKQGLGVQLIGQAVLHARQHGKEHLSVHLPANEEARHFFKNLGFFPVETTRSPMILRKNIGFNPNILNS